MKRAAIGFFLAVAACGSKPGVQHTDGGISHIPATGGTHVSCSSDCGNAANPPTGGQHCGNTLACRKYDAEQNRCVWLHNLEHGHAVLAYNCPEGCPEIVAALGGIFDAAQSDPKKRRIMLTPDSKLPARVAAVVWGYSYSADTVDEAAIQSLLSHQDEEAPEPGLPCAQ